MNVAFLFNSDYPAFKGSYGRPIMERILRTGVLQQAQRNMRVSIGDTGTYSYVAQHGQRRTIDEVIEWDMKLYRSESWDRIIRKRLAHTYGVATVYCWLFQNMTDMLAESLHQQLIPFRPYLGAMAVDFAEPLHLAFFRNRLIERYRFCGASCGVFCSMSDNEDPDISVEKSLQRHGFSVYYEDIGARRTIFDNYDALEHFERVRDFAAVFSEFASWSRDDSADLTLYLEELHPRLFDILAAAARTYHRAETPEELAQVALSGRRFLEALADMLFPPRSQQREGFDVGNAKHRNRLWAYVKDVMVGRDVFNEQEFARLGKEVDRLFEFFNSGLHHNTNRDTVGKSLRDLGCWTLEMIRLNPEAARKPYLAYSKEMKDFFLRVLQE